MGMNTKIYKGQIKIGNNSYHVEVINGIRYIEGKTIDEFFLTLPIEEVNKLYHIGKQAIEDEKDGLQDTDCGYQQMLNNLK